MAEEPEESGQEAAAESESASTSLATREETSTELTQAQLDEMDALANETKGAIDLQQDVTLPSLVLLQKTHDLEEGERAGQIKHSLTGEVFSTAHVVLVKMVTTRTYWGKKEGLGGAPPACSSPNALDGWGDPSDEDLERDDPTHDQQNRPPEPYGQRLDVKGPNGGGSCKDCPKNRFGDNSCQLQYQYLAVLVGPVPEGEDPRDINAELPVGFLMKRTSIKTAKQINSLLLNMRFPWSNVIELTSSKETNSRNQEYYIWQAKKGRPATMDELVRAASVAGMVRDVERRGGTVSVAGEGPAPDADVAAADAAAKDEDIPF